MKDKIRVSIYSKGFPVTKEHGEFQLIVPNRYEKLSDGIEKEIANNPNWPSIISGFYDISESIALESKCIIFGNNEMAIIKGYPIRENGKRPGIIFLIAISNIDKEKMSGRQIASAMNLSNYLIKEYSEIIKENSKNLLRQLGDGKFLEDREFELDLENAREYESLWYSDLLKEVVKWENIRGVSDFNTLKIGANILIGSDVDATKNASLNYIDGYYDPVSKLLTPIRENIKQANINRGIEDPYYELKREVIEIKESLQVMQVALQDIPKLIIATFQEIVVDALFQKGKKKSNK
ncbi:hypothetical protein [Leptospira noguchii]|uniref:hypothetical protein n=1 Tax=Leptospira noguchii TaxID=28182 RepID=UPI000773CBB1|nr:hypothetical protein [Leptospira noguchii]